ncbi:hypothetical protein FA13DRAFT_1779023 [Coprinellus micaceus]|uniref:DUF1996 domain-containing protein n=1 Tax=Coprinellus micaceus TaxID=71717 RepID=A0A4Y7SJ78_COPMI|nr:hypothetical protein FA13DRAFT_1779023 [Coprinellus micaceus]
MRVSTRTFPWKDKDTETRTLGQYRKLLLIPAGTLPNPVKNVLRPSNAYFMKSLTGWSQGIEHVDRTCRRREYLNEAEAAWNLDGSPEEGKRLPPPLITFVGLLLIRAENASPAFFTEQNSFSRDCLLTSPTFEHTSKSVEMLPNRSLLPIAVFIQAATATIRFGCSQLVTERFDPLVTPGQVAPHVHQIIGGNAFNLSMDPQVDYAETATCTTCRFKEDKSNYWTAILYFKHSEWKLHSGPAEAKPCRRSDEGRAYCVLHRRIPSLPEGYRVRQGAGRTTNGSGSLIITLPGIGRWDSVGLPQTFCPGGIRSNIFFPSCWDGENLDSPDHFVRLTWHIPTGPVDARYGVIWHQGPCPPATPVKVPTILYEIAWDTAVFQGTSGLRMGRQPLIMSMGDPTATTYSVGRAILSSARWITARMSSGIPIYATELTLLTDDEMNGCTQPALVPEKVEGEYLPALPGMQPRAIGPRTSDDGTQLQCSFHYDLRRTNPCRKLGGGVELSGLSLLR